MNQILDTLTYIANFERGVRKAIWEQLEKPSLNKHGGLRFQLSHTWDQSLINRALPIDL